MAHGSGGLNLVSDALRSRVFDLLRRDSKHSKRKSRTDFHLLFVGETHTHSSPFRNASAPVSVLCSKLEVNDVIKRKCADDARSTLLGAGRVCPIPVGALRWAVGGAFVPVIFWFRPLVPGDKNYRRGPGFVICASARAGGFLTCTDARESVQILEAVGRSAPM